VEGEEEQPWDDCLEADYAAPLIHYEPQLLIVQHREICWLGSADGCCRLLDWITIPRSQ
jgi:hypothetical protein